MKRIPTLVAALAAAVALLVPLGAQPAGAAPVLALSKTTGILDGEVVIATGSGFTPGEVVRVVQCIGDAPDFCPQYPPINGNGASVTVAPDGTLRARLRLWRTIDVPAGQDESCTNSDCSVQVLNSGDELLAQAFIDAADTGTATRPPAALSGTTLAATPNRVDLRVAGSGFDPDYLTVEYDIDGQPFAIGFLTPSRGAYLAICRPTGPGGTEVCGKYQGRTMTRPGFPVLNGLRRVPVDAAGVLPPTDLAIPRVLDLREGRVDCAVARCRFAITQDAFPISPSVGVTYAPEWAPYPSAGAMVDDAYARLVGRAPTSSERAAAVSGLTGRSLTARAFVTGLAERTDGLRYAELARLYQAALRRQPDGAGLSYWSGQLRANGGDMGVVATAFGRTTEFRERYGPTVSAADAVDNAYVAILDRGATSSERAYWVGRLQAGMTRSKMVHHFSRSPEFVAAEGGRSRAGAVAVGLLRRGPTAGEWAAMQPYAGISAPPRESRVDDVVLAYLASTVLKARVG